jgi:hypothetical protein
LQYWQGGSANSYFPSGGKGELWVAGVKQTPAI